ncbi:MAG: hypothetical protein HC875_01690 [Anaerolineales bacterium]|nr:hypothetical protein [Anaerolineales bacterium]
MAKYFTKTMFLGRLFVVVVIVIGTLSLSEPLAAAPVAQVAGSILPPDSDLDGLADTVELQGWINERVNDQGGGAPYFTDPYDADSDDDGLTDGEEKLFNTHPLDNKNPGLYTIYEDRFETSEYSFAWTPVARSGLYRPYGHRMIGLNTLVIRRGTTFTVGGPRVVDGAAVTLNWSDGLKNPGVLSPLTIGQSNPCGDQCNSWNVTAPSNSTVGKYKLTASNGQGWTDTLIVDVIFEMPSDLTPAQVDAFLYDGDRNNKRDETGIWFYGNGTDPDQDLKIRLYALSYDFSQYAAFIFDGAEAVRYYGKTASQYPSAIQVIHGLKTTWDASDRLTKQADAFTCFAYPLTPRTTAWNTLFPGSSNLNNQCSNIAGLVTSLHRSVGIPARMVAVDHRGSNFDTSTEIWTRSSSSGSYNWYTARAFVSNEGDPNNLGYCTQTHVANGYYPRVSRAEWGRTRYKPYSKVWPSRGNGGSNGNEWMMVTANENWVLEDARSGSSVDYKWVVWDKYNVVRQDWFETLAMPYWNSNYRVDLEPVDLGEPEVDNPPAWNQPAPSDWLPTVPPGTPTLNPIANADGDGSYIVNWTNASEAQYYQLEEDSNPDFTSPTTRYYGGSKTKNITGQPSGTWYYRVRAENNIGTSATWSNIQSVTVGSGSASLVAAETSSLELMTLQTVEDPASASLKVRLGEVVNEYGLDENSDGQFEALVLQVELDAIEAGSYWIQGQLGTDHPTAAPSGGIIAIDEFQVNLEQGRQLVNLLFDGLSLSRNRIDGPYQLMHLLVTDVENPTPLDFANASIASKNNSHVTAAYKFNAFKTSDAMFARSFNDRAIDLNQDGFAEGVEIEAVLDIYRSGNFTVVGELYDSNDLLLGEATWSGTDSRAVLRFNYIAGASGPFELRNLRLSRADGQGLDELERAYTTQNVIQGQPVSGFVASPSADSGGIGTMGVGITTTTYLDIPVDTNANGKYDALEIKAGIEVVTPDNYQLEGWLVDEQGELVSWTQTGPVSLAAGTQELSLTYDGRTLADYMKTRGLASQKFTLVALKLYTGPLKWNEINDEVDVAYTTRSYGINEFEPAVKGAVVSLEDYVENGVGQWTAQEPWSLVETGTYFSPTHAWRAGNANAVLDTVLNLDNVADPILKFRTYYQLAGSGESAYVKVSGNGSNWQTVATFSGTIKSWETQELDLRTYDGQPNLYLRFELNSTGGASNDFWYLDDLLIVFDSFDTDGDGLADENDPNPTNPDTDGDGLPDGWEVDHGSDPTVNNGSDLDNDGLSNADEFVHSTDPLNPDTDGDGLPDGWEVSTGLDPNDDADDNGADGDPDNDDLTNEEEYNKGTDPNKPDTDNDGIPDNEDPRIDFMIFLPAIFK